MDSNGSSSKNTKTIQISEDVFSMSTKKTSKAKTLKRKPRPVIDTAQLQEQLLNNMKLRSSITRNRKDDTLQATHAPNTVVSTPKSIPTPPPKVLSEYEASLIFMNTLSLPPKRSKPAKIEPPKPEPINPATDPSISSTVSTGGLSYKVDNDVAHGCLKNGIKKTYKNITSKNTSSHKVSFNLSDVSQVDDAIGGGTSSTIIIHDAVPPATPDEYIDPVVLSSDTLEKEEPDTPTENVKKVHIEDQKIAEPIVSTDVPAPRKPQQNTTIIRPMSTKKNKHLKTIRKTFKLGKHPTQRVVSVFCKSAEMITEIKKVQAKMKTVKLDNMKRYLVRKSLLSIGSPAPSDVIKQLYLSAVASGDVVNHNDDVLLKNFMGT
jgi:hypothetical protein